MRNGQAVETAIKIRDLEFHQRDVISEFAMQKVTEFVRIAIDEISETPIITKSEVGECIRREIEEQLKHHIASLLYNDDEINIKLRAALRKAILAQLDEQVT